MFQTFSPVAVDRFRVPPEEPVDIAGDFFRQDPHGTVLHEEKIPHACFLQRAPHGTDHRVKLLLHRPVIRAVLLQRREGLRPGDAAALFIHQESQQLLAPGIAEGDQPAVHIQIEPAEGANLDPGRRPGRPDGHGIGEFRGELLLFRRLEEISGGVQGKGLQGVLGMGGQENDRGFRTLFPDPLLRLQGFFVLQDELEMQPVIEEHAAENDADGGEAEDLGSQADGIGDWS